MINFTTAILNLLVLGFILTSICSITATNPVISVIFLITTFVQVALYLILIGVNFIGISYIVIYVGAIAVLFLFVIMMINIKLTDVLETGYNYTKNLPIGLNIALLFIFIIISLLSNDNNSTGFNLTQAWTAGGFTSELLNYDFLTKNNLVAPFLRGGANSFGWISNNYNSDVNFSNFVQIEVIGHSLYIFNAILLIILSLILLLSMLAIIVISKNNNKNI